MLHRIMQNLNVSLMVFLYIDSGHVALYGSGFEATFSTPNLRFKVNFDYKCKMIDSLYESPVVVVIIFKLKSK